LFYANARDVLAVVVTRWFNAASRLDAQRSCFDLDGTLVDSLPDLRAALNEMLRSLARRELSADEVRCMIGDGTHALVERALRATGEVVDISAPLGTSLENAHLRFLDFYQAAPTRLSRLYPDVATTLGSLTASGAHLAICTNNSKQPPSRCSTDSTSPNISK
jgi:phosphoglycolate phosphatase